MDVPTLSMFLRPILTVTSVWITGETGGIELVWSRMLRSTLPTATWCNYIKKILYYCYIVTVFCITAKSTYFGAILFENDEFSVTLSKKVFLENRISVAISTDQHRLYPQIDERRLRFQLLSFFHLKKEIAVSSLCLMMSVGDAIPKRGAQSKLKPKTSEAK